MLAIAGLGGWWGKEIAADDTAINLVHRQGNFEYRFPMLMIEETSFLDGKTGRSFHYRKDNPFPWPYIVDEMRRIDDNHILGMTLANIRPFRRFGFPFVLEYKKPLHQE